MRLEKNSHKEKARQHLNFLLRCPLMLIDRIIQLGIKKVNETNSDKGYRKEEDR